MDNKMEIGKIVNTHSLKGEVKLTAWCDEDMLDSLKYVYIKDETFEIMSIKPHKNSYLVKFKGVDHIDDAEKLKNKVLFAKISDLPPLEENTYYVKDLINLEVFLITGEKLGDLVDLFPTGSNDVYVVKTPEGKDILLPAIKQVVKKIDIENKRITVELMDGLCPD